MSNLKHIGDELLQIDLPSDDVDAYIKANEISNIYTKVNDVLEKHNFMNFMDVTNQELSSEGFNINEIGHINDIMVTYLMADMITNF